MTVYYGVYRIRNLVNDKSYVGSGDLQARLWSHAYNLDRKTHFNKYLQRAWDKYGKDKFEFSVVKICRKEDCIKHEIEWMNKLDVANHGYNILLPSKGMPSKRWSKAEKDKKKKPHTKKKKAATKHQVYYFRGRSRTTKRWAEEFNINHSTLLDRLSKGYSIYEALFIPFEKGNPLRLNRLDYRGKRLLKRS